MNSDIVIINNIEFKTLVAITPAEHSKGLMFQKWPPPVMCFPYKQAGVRKFWMHQTCSPLDIVFCNKNVIVAICEGVPYSTAMVGPNSATDLVIEFPRGTMDYFGVKVGDHVKFMPTLKTVSGLGRFF